jgi:hypothetical protein
MDELKKAIELEEMGVDPDHKEEEENDNKKMEELLNKAEEKTALTSELSQRASSSSRLRGT